MTLEEKWNEKLDILLDFKKINGRWPKTTENHNGVKIGLWMGNVRTQYIHEKMSKERIKKLKKINFPFHKREELWSTKFEILKSFLKEYKRFPKADESHMGERIGKWCITQRGNLKNGILSKEHKKKLSSIGFPWSMIGIAPNEMWLDSCREVSLKIKVRPELADPLSRNECITWIRLQRRRFLNNDLTEYQIHFLKEQGINITLKKWDKKPSKIKKKTNYQMHINRVLDFYNKSKKFPKRQRYANLEEDSAAMSLKKLCLEFSINKEQDIRFIIRDLKKLKKEYTAKKAA